MVGALRKEEEVLSEQAGYRIKIVERAGARLGDSSLEVTLLVGVTEEGRSVPNASQKKSHANGSQVGG